MFYSNKKNLNQLLIYKKSIDLFKLCRRVASYITDDKDVISMYRSGSRLDNYADNLVINAFRLVPKIVETESQENSKEKLRYAKSLRYYIDMLYKNCQQLESTKINGREFVKILRKELSSFRRIHTRYVKSIL